MDRVLLIVDDIQYSRHIEMTLRKVGFEVEPLNNEYGLNDSLLTFNPDYVICRGQSSRLSAVSVSKKLRDQGSKFSGKVVLVFPQGFEVPRDELVKMKVDLVLFEPLSTLRLAIQLFMFNQSDLEFIKDKLLKFAITDNQFRNYEQQLLRHAGTTIDSEIQMISGLAAASELESSYVRSQQAEPEPPVSAVLDQPSGIQSLHDEIVSSYAQLNLRIDSYNRAIGKVDQDLKIGLKKRQTKKVANQLQKDLLAEKKAGINSADDQNSDQKNDQDSARREFARALFKK